MSCRGKGRRHGAVCTEEHKLCCSCDYDSRKMEMDLLIHAAVTSRNDDVKLVCAVMLMLPLLLWNVKETLYITEAQHTR